MTGKGWMMKFSYNLLVFSAVCMINLSAGAETQITSIYTDLSGNNCKIIKEDRETGSSVRRCPGVGGFHLLIADDDSRMSISVVTPDRKEHPLDYWNVITRSFSSLGNKAEWRVIKHQEKIAPIALIVRVNAYEHGDLASPKNKSYLAVAKITAGEICVTRKIGPTVNANEQARRAADHSAKQLCLKP